MRLSFILLLSGYFSTKIYPEDVQDMKIYARYSNVAYCDPQGIRTFKCEQCEALSTLRGTTVKAVISPTLDEQAAIFEEADKIVVAFRGSATWPNTLTNICFAPSIYASFLLNTTEAQAHNGFLEYYFRLRPQLIRFLSSTEVSSKHIVFTGHSLGGAIATIAAADAQANLQLRSVSLFTYGEPRVGNDAFVHFLRASRLEKSFRVVNEKDPVPQIPFRDDQYEIFDPLSPPLFGYVHRSGEVLLKNNNAEILECEDFGNEDPECALGEYKFRKGWFPLLMAEFATQLDYHLNYFNFRITNCESVY